MIEHLVNCPVCAVKDGTEPKNAARPGQAEAGGARFGRAGSHFSPIGPGFSGSGLAWFQARPQLHPFGRYAVLSMYWLNRAKLDTLKTGRGALQCKTHCNFFFFYHAEATLFLGAVHLFVKYNSNTNHAHNDFSTVKSRVNCSADTAISRDL